MAELKKNGIFILSKQVLFSLRKEAVCLVQGFSFPVFHKPSFWNGLQTLGCTLLSIVPTGKASSLQDLSNL